MTNPSRRAHAARLLAAKRWYVYLLWCRNGAIYTGIARDVPARFAQHAAGTGARYTRANPPVEILARFRCANQSEASRWEAAIKRLSATDKRRLVGRTGVAVRKVLFG
ncbi:MAG: GIY-YIG nuclease family protein [Betaproteobacteria bacterium]